MSDEDLNTDDPYDRDTKELMESQGLDKDTAERVLEIMNKYGVDEEDAIELEDLGE